MEPDVVLGPPPPGRDVKRSLALAVLLLFMAGAPGVRADVGAPVSGRLAGPARSARLGQVFADTLIVVSAVDGAVTDFRLEGDAWSGVWWAAESEFPVTAGLPVHIPFHGTPLEGPWPLVATFRLGTATGQVTLDLSAEAYEQSLGPGAAVKVPEAEAPPPGAEYRQRTLASPGVTPESLARTDVSAAAPPGGAQGGTKAQARWIRMFGRFGYRRLDNLFVGADAVTVYGFHQKEFGDQQLFAVATDPWGYFDVTFFWNGNGDPNLYLLFELNNNRVHVKGADALSSAWRWRTATTYSYSGSSLDCGTSAPGTAVGSRAASVHTGLMRTWRWLYNRGYDCAPVAGRYPAGGWSVYTHDLIYGQAIFIVSNATTDHGWNENVQAHEYGHHFVDCFATVVEPDYCNSRCDTPFCNHCMWCQETDHDAFAEGFPNWLADAVTRSLAADYGISPLTALSQENLGLCGAIRDVPHLTEGFLGAALRDIEDATQDNHGVFVGGKDELALGTDEILACVDLDQPTTSVGMLAAFKARYPQVKEQLWATARNCGFDLDLAPPGAVTGLTSPTHPVGGPASPDPQITVTWTRATDDCSGIQGYSFLLTPYPLVLGPDATQEIGDVTSYRSDILTPGNWWFSIRAIDRFLQPSSDWASIGPLIVRDAGPANLLPTVPIGWFWEQTLVPRATPDGNALSCFSTALVGDTTFYVNGLTVNYGESGTDEISYTELYLDGSWVSRWPVFPLAAGTGATHLNEPALATGGRHTLSCRVDGLHDVAEANETDNADGHQWSWTPLALASGSTVQRASPPARYGGIETIPGGPSYQNCDGLRFATDAPTSQQWWTAAWLYCLDNQIDYDLNLHQPTTSQHDGFAAPTAWSAFGPGWLDFVVVNNNHHGAQNWDLGIIDYTDATNGDYRLGVTGSTTISPSAAQSLVSDLAPDQMLRLWEVSVGELDTGPLSLVADLADPQQGPVWLAWFDRFTTTAGPGGATAVAASNPQTGRVRLDLTVNDAGYYLLALYRNPNGAKSGNAGTTGAKAAPALAVTLTVEPTPPDFEPLLVSGWEAPLVPRAAADGTLFNVPPPLALPGDGTTFLNLAAAVSRAPAAVEIPVAVRLDGQPAAVTALPVNGELGFAALNSSPALTVSGGRHVLAMYLDPLDAVRESFETNNLYGRQWVWTPPVMALGVPLTRAAPPPPSGGWEDLTTEDVLLANCDGLRTPVFAPTGTGGGWFCAVAVVPGALSDTDLALHELSAGAQSGFAAPLAVSAAITGRADHVLANLGATDWREFDVGITRWTGTEDYTAETVVSTPLGAPPGTYGPFTLAGGNLLLLHELTLAPGTWRLRLENFEGNVDWGLTLHDALAPFGGKLPPRDDRLADEAGPGQGELLAPAITTAGTYALAVWKAGAADVPLTGRYRLIAEPVASAVPGDGLPGAAPPAVSALRSAHPNPFNPSTTIVFELAREQPVALSIHSPRGDRLRTLRAGVLPAGRHEAVWDGTDDAGGRVASGVYLVMLTAPGVVDELKIVLLK